LNAGIALRALRNFEAAKLEMQASLRSKPDFELGYAALGFLLTDLSDFDGAIEQYRKALTLNPGSEGALQSRLHVRHEG
jgi:tetratricopeptide (TPR) repeat protein